MYTKEDFLEAVKEEALKNELTAALYHAGDPRFLQMQGAIAQMLAMYSQQLEVAMQEPFLKSRDATVLADAALKGLIFTAKPAIVQIKAINNGNTPVRIEAGRYLFDASGRMYRIDSPVTLPASTQNNGEGEIMATQLQFVKHSHTMSESYPFYAIEVEEPKDGSYISTIQVKVNGEVFDPCFKFNGVDAGEKVFHIESDEYKRLYVKFGETSVVGFQPSINDVITIECGQCFGDIQPELGSTFSFQYIQANEENEINLEMKALKRAGKNPIDIATLRNLCNYPSTYDDNAVFLGEFDKLLRKNFNHLAFLAVWNEQIEEKIRGADINNVNTLFYSFALPDNSVESKESIKRQISQVIAEADDSYKTKFVEPITEKIHITVNAIIARAYDVLQVKAQIIDLLLQEYGKNAFSTKQGKVVVKNKEVFSLIEQAIPALADKRSDLNVSISNGVNSAPEVFRYLDKESITINLTSNGYESSVWGGKYNTVE
ncbi:hypothetical protein [Avibacterium paragallinarum]|uniref:hypothetical protein n=1 Tax=Avibacterium paragallinarum TaxID=728 RepID=UPI002282EBC5|nr:hypothetical protein [Avibacterium paragallinarum]WAL56603.1 hypothetical protein OY678_11820 [Avibacterium paragallinarum]